MTSFLCSSFLIVTGELTFNGNIDYNGMIFVIGEGSMRRNGAGNGTINGGILVANTAGPDGIPGTGDDAVVERVIFRIARPPWNSR